MTFGHRLRDALGRRGRRCVGIDPHPELLDTWGVTDSAFGVETFPRFVVLDGAGVVRWVFRGVGAETGYLVCREVEKLLAAPTGAAAPVGTTGPPGPPPAVPRGRP